MNGILTVTDGTGGEPDPVPVDSPYTVSLRPSSTSVGLGGAVDVDVVVTDANGANFSAYDIAVTYDTTLFTYGEDTTGKINITDYDKDFASGDTVKTLTFTATDSLAETATGSFGVTKALIAVAGDSMGPQNAYVAATSGADVQVLLKYAVNFVGRDGASLGSVSVTEGGTVATADIPEAPAIDHYVFQGWNDGTGTLCTADEIAEKSVTGPVTYTAQYEAETYSVTLGDGLSGADTATYGQNYTGTVVGYDGSNYNYTVTAAFANGTEKEYAVDSTGGFTVPAEDVTGAMTLTLSRQIQGVTAEVYEDYVGGYSLIVVYGGADGYDYNGNAMYRTARYDTDTADETDKAFAYIILGTTDEDAVLAALSVSDTAAQEITGSKLYDVNASGDADIRDVQAVADCYRVREEMENYMQVYLRADVNASHKVDSTDANDVLSGRDGV